MTLSNLSDRGTLRGTLQRNSGNYNDLINKPAINGHALIGYQSGHALGLANEDDIIYVEANPLGPATADLHKILVDDTIYSIPDVVVYGNASGDIASFDDGGDNKPLKSLKVAINPVQSGSGDPSPSNVRPISGWTGANLARDENNLINFEDITEPKTANVWKGVDVDLPIGNYVISFDLTNVNRGATTASYVVGIADKDGYITNYTTQDVKRVSDNVTMQSLSNPINGRFYVNVINKSIHSIVFYWRSNTYMLLSSGAVTNIMLHQTDKSFTPYQGTTYPIAWSEAGTVYGGTLDVTNGKLKARPYYASYNGETLIGPWISSMDVYAPNTPPTTGAQVVDLGGVETEIDISPTQITSLLGNNNIWSNTGEIEECVYQRDLNIAINKALSQ